MHLFKILFIFFNIYYDIIDTYQIYNFKGGFVVRKQKVMKVFRIISITTAMLLLSAFYIFASSGGSTYTTYDMKVGAFLHGPSIFFTNH